MDLFSWVHTPTAKLITTKIRSPILTPVPHQSQATSILPFMWKPLLMLSVVCTSMMIGHATAVYYVRASWVWRFTKIKPSKKFFFRFLEPINEILCLRKFQRTHVYSNVLNVSCYGSVTLLPLLLHKRSLLHCNTTTANNKQNIDSDRSCFIDCFSSS